MNHEINHKKIYYSLSEVYATITDMSTEIMYWSNRGKVGKKWCL